MQFSASLVAFLAIAAAPASALYLNNGVSIVEVSVESETNSTLARRDDFNCKGSSRCTNAQGFKNQCTAAFNLIEDTVYTVGGAGSGTCSGSCGVFVQGTCPGGVSGAALRTGYNNIRASGCQACGSDQFGSCEITINFVTGC
ncbi:hypothetical protein GALMADRAFT_208961 [Galerina marginata CBS 339.88]|uniref:Cyanovirin-N domain-containing protein n=1 Tax=Galerina marginata (strain CBS 339.88) TaxID=685588 RepID=A0A067TBE4_GALM3|nr:hypothetical protein GALMADRAFT_208961 [Galerina marginata CBS 339.88]